MEVVEKQETATLMVRVTTPVSELPKVIGEVYGELTGYVKEKGIVCSGPPFALYRNMDMEALEVELGFPVSAPAEGRGRIEAGTIPGGKAVSALHIGPYSELERSYRKVMDYIAEQKLEVTPWMYESYLDDPAETPPGELKTEIVFPLA